MLFFRPQRQVVRCLVSACREPGPRTYNLSRPSRLTSVEPFGILSTTRRPARDGLHLGSLGPGGVSSVHAFTYRVSEESNMAQGLRTVRPC